MKGFNDLPFAISDIRQVAMVSGIMAAGLAGGSEIMQIRWAPAVTTHKLAILLAQFSAVSDGTAFTAGVTRFNLNKVTAWTVDGSGGTALDLSGVRGKVFPDAPTYSVPTVRASSTAALTAGTKTIGIDTTYFHGAAAAANSQLVTQQDLISPLILQRMPYILGNQEGLILSATVPATGTWRFAINLAFGVIATQ